ncbi:MAG: hypothetical protein AAFS11_09755, partial [Planctomycetota bacterium]
MTIIFFGLPAIAAALVDPKQRFASIFDSLRLADYITLPMPLSGLVFPSLFALSFPLLLALLGDPSFRARDLWNFRAFLREACEKSEADGEDQEDPLCVAEKGSKVPEI